jgi:hypothetical protein
MPFHRQALSYCVATRNGAIPYPTLAFQKSTPPSAFFSK